MRPTRSASPAPPQPHAHGLAVHVAPIRDRASGSLASARRVDGRGEGRAGARGSRRPSRVARPAVGVGSTTLAAPGPVGGRLRPPKRQRGPHRWRLQRSARPSPLAYIRYGRGPHRWRLLRSARPAPLACVTVRARRSPLPATLSSQLGELTKSRLCTLIRVKRERSSSRYRERTSSTRCRSSCPVRRAWHASAPRRSRRSRRFREPRG